MKVAIIGIIILTVLFVDYCIAWKKDYRTSRNSLAISFLCSLAQKNMLRFFVRDDSVELVKTGEIQDCDKYEQAFFDEVFNKAQKVPFDENATVDYECVRLSDIAKRYKNWLNIFRDSDNKKKKKAHRMHSEKQALLTIVVMEIAAIIMSLVYIKVNDEGDFVEMAMMAFLMTVGAVLWMAGMELLAKFVCLVKNADMKKEKKKLLYATPAFIIIEFLWGVLVAGGIGLWLCLTEGFLINFMKIITVIYVFAILFMRKLIFKDDRIGSVILKGSFMISGNENMSAKEEQQIAEALKKKLDMCLTEN